MLSSHEKNLLRDKILEVELALEDVRACLDPLNNIALEEVRRRSWTCRALLAELKRFCMEDLS